jgi:hypothetical protein
VSLVVECSILVELVVQGGLAQFLVVHGEKVITPSSSFFQDTLHLVLAIEGDAI